MQRGMQQPMLRKQYPTGDASPMAWPVDGGAQAPGRNGMSVVTTVWGMTPGTQTPGSRHPAAGFENMAMYQRGAGVQPRTPTTPAAGYPTTQPGFYNRQNSLPSGPGPGMAPQYRPQYNQPPNGNPEYQPPPGALSAAAMVAAAATATATATASVMIQQEPQTQYHRQPAPGQHANPMGHQYSVQYGAQGGMRVQSPSAMMVGREISAGGQMPGGPMPTQHVYRRTSPYGNPQQVMIQRKQQYPQNMPQYGAMTPQPTSYNPPVHGQYPPHIRHPSNMMVPGSQPVTYNNGAPPPYANAGPYPQVMNRNPPSQPMPSQSPYQNGYSMPQNMQDVKPGPIPSGNEQQLTFPIRDGTVLPPFRLEHNLPVSHHVFHLKDQVFQTLIERQDSEVQLKCFHHEDRSQSPNWPTSVSISVNGRSLYIERGEVRTYHKPLYLKSVIVPGKNTITISVCACCCSHLFVLQLVHRPTVKSILNGLIKKRFLPAEHCISKIKANFANTNLSGVTSAETDGVEQTSVKVTVKCPVTFLRMALPARGSECRHIQCFDLEPYLRLNAERGLWRCPVCAKDAMLDGLEIDQYMWGIIEQLSKSPDVEEISIDANASWKTVVPKIMAKEEDSKDLCAVNNWMKVYSPSSTKMPSVGSFEGHVNPMSPYPTPPNSHNSQGSNSIAHFAGGVYDVGFNSPPDFTGPMSNRSDMSDHDKRLVVLQRQQSGIASPSQGPASNVQAPASNAYSVPPGGPASNAPPMMPSGPASNMATGGPPSNAPMSQGPPSNAPASQGPPSNAPASHGGPASNTPVGNNSPNTTPSAGTELPADISDLVNNASNDNLDGFDVDLLAYLGPQESESNNENNLYNNPTSTDDEDILALLAGDS